MRFNRYFSEPFDADDRRSRGPKDIQVLGKVQTKLMNPYFFQNLKLVSKTLSLLVWTVEGTSYPVEISYLDDLVKKIKTPRFRNSHQDFSPEIDSAQFTDYQVNMCVEILKYLDETENDGDIGNQSVLVFLPGLHEIQRVYRQISSYLKKEKKKYFIQKIHSSIPRDASDMKKLMTPTKDGSRKVGYLLSEIWSKI